MTIDSVTNTAQAGAIAAPQGDVLLLTDRLGSKVWADLDILMPGRVAEMDFRTAEHGRDVLRPFAAVVTVVANGTKVQKLDYGEVDAYARAGGTVVSCLYEYCHHRRLQFSKTHANDGPPPGMVIRVTNEITRGYAVGDSLDWYGTVSTAPNDRYENQFVQRQILGLKESAGLAILGTSTVNGGAVMVEERLGAGRILALDLLSPNRPWYNSHGSTHKWLFVGNLLCGSVRYGKHYPKRLRYDEFVQEMRALAGRYPRLQMREEGQASDGRTMYSLHLGDAGKPTIYLGAALHGWEWENAFGLLRLVELLCQDSHIEGMPTDILAFTVVPIQNPWGLDHFTRQNARGVDLNRNFDAAWQEYDWDEDVSVPWDYSYKGTEPASEPETKVIQAIIDRERPLCVVDFHTADYSVDCARGTDREFIEAMQACFGARIKDRYVCQFHAGGYGGYRQVAPGPTEPEPPREPMFIQYASEHGARASFLVEMSGDRDDVHALVMNTDVTVETCLAVVEQCLRRYLGWQPD